MPRIFSKFLISLLAGVVLFLSIAPAALAQTPQPAASIAPGPWYNQQVGQFAGKVFGGDQNEIFGERYTYAQTSWIFMSVLLTFYNFATQGRLAGCLTTVATGNAQTCFDDAKTFLSGSGSPSFLPSSYNNKGGSFFAFVFSEDRPLSGITYVRNIGRKFKLIPEAKAQSTGFGYTGALTFGGAFTSIQDFWTVMRNFAYVIFVVVIIVFAFMIMFRVKISPQVVVTVQSALPKIAITLILVTFSYAIAGLLIDLMYVVIGIFSLIFSQITVAGVSANIGTTAALSPAGYFDLLTKGPAFLGSGSGIFGMLLMYWVNFFVAFIVVGIGGILTGITSGITCLNAGTFVAQGTLGFIFFILYLIALLVLIIIAVVNFFRIVWLLARTFLIIILLTVFAPIQLTLGAIIPGLSFGSWVKSYVSKLAVFVGVGVTFILSLWFLQMAWNVIQQAFFNSVTTGQCPNYPAGWPPLMGGSPQMVAFLFMLASFGVFCMIPSVGNMIESFVSGKAFNFGSAIGEATNPLGVRRLATETLGTYFGNQLYNPRGGTGAIPDWVNRIRSGRGSRAGGGTPPPGGAGGPPTPVGP